VTRKKHRALRSSLVALLACGPLAACAFGGTAPTPVIAPPPVPPDDSAGPKLYALVRAAPSATLVPDGANAHDVLGAGIAQAASWMARGMSPEGPMAKASLKEKDRVYTEVTLQAGKCYVIVGFSPMDQVTDLDLHMLKAPGLMVAEDKTDNSTPQLGSPPFCQKEDETFTIDIFADRGAGDVAMQVYFKPITWKQR